MPGFYDPGIFYYRNMTIYLTIVIYVSNFKLFKELFNFYT